MQFSKKTIRTFVPFLIGISLIGYAFLNIWLHNQPIIPTIGAQTTSKEDTNTPISLKIDSINVNLPINTVRLVEGKWENPRESVGYWSNSPLPGEKGNSVFYGHNWPNIFGSLKKIKSGDIIEIKMSDSSQREFKVEQTSIVTDDQTHILNQTEDTRVTIYTCTGFLDSKRFVVVAIPVPQAELGMVQ